MELFIMRLSLKNTAEVCHYFANQVQNEGYAGNVRFSGNDFYSYRTIVAKRINGFIVISDYSYSMTTSSHLSDLRQACSHKNIIHIPKVEGSAATNKANIEYDIKELFKKASTARTKKDKYIAQALYKAEQFNKYCNISENQEYLINLSVFDNIDFVAIKANEKQRQALELAKRKARDSENALENSVKITQWLNCERDSLGYGVSSDTLLRVKGDMIQTSRGAEIPVNSAFALWTLVHTVIAGGRDIQLNRKIGVYTLTDIDTLGNITVGCHYIQFKELQRIAKILGYI